MSDYHIGMLLGTFCGMFYGFWLTVNIQKWLKKREEQK